ncbi:MAG TPA: glycosyltransferase [Candidatus Limnocylindrales bacterium]|jgi:Glycosyltransferase|nr:glycosyltransferase [Candidatus Limnocylindrales bacterium]
MGAEHEILEPCLDNVAREPIDGGRVRVLEVMATGTNGGAQEHVHSLVTRLNPECYEVRVVSLSHGSSVRRLQRAGVDVTVIDEPDDRRAVRELADSVASFAPEIIHNHMYRAEVIGTRAALLLGEKGCKRPAIISTVHSSRIRCVDDRQTIRQLTLLMDRLIVVSRAIEGKVREEGRVGAPVSLIYNGVDLQRYNHQQPCCTLHDEYRIPEDAPIVGVVARLEAEKGHRTLIDAWPEVLAAVPNAWLLVVGEGSERDALEAEAASLGVNGRIVFTGRREDVPAVTAALDVAVLPSYREAQGLSVLEAMALSRPVVASNVGGIPEMIEDGVTGLLVPPNDCDALAAALIKLLTDHPYADMIARRGHDLVHERFCIELMVNSIESIYDEEAAKLRIEESVAR